MGIAQIDRCHRRLRGLVVALPVSVVEFVDDVAFTSSSDPAGAAHENANGKAIERPGSTGVDGVAYLVPSKMRAHSVPLADAVSVSWAGSKFPLGLSGVPLTNFNVANQFTLAG